MLTDGQLMLVLLETSFHNKYLNDADFVTLAVKPSGYELCVKCSSPVNHSAINKSH